MTDRETREAERSSLPHGSHWPILEKYDREHDLAQALFQWGPTKNAVILRDMCQTLDQVVPSFKATDKIGSALQSIDTVIDMVKEQKERRAKYMGNRSGLKEQFIYRELDFQVKRLDYLPYETVSLFKAVVKEKVNMLKGRPQKYTTHDVYVWAQAAYVAEARQNWKQHVIKSLKRSKAHFGYGSYGSMVD